ncbi:hypothetical protein Agub_g2593 [Astrephomene gubernaculifera]|uniref:SRCR domain-containing protein n=1 Tax=Astrephomene gubernaculifera TaxID=47775 RepID=A0AAD3DL08_9CHLO|nr:hypothetical protein Agub_g2593 [Astrephomene gubernaculifera]
MESSLRAVQTRFPQEVPRQYGIRFCILLLVVFGARSVHGASTNSKSGAAKGAGFSECAGLPKALAVACRSMAGGGRRRLGDSSGLLGLVTNSTSTSNTSSSSSSASGGTSTNATSSSTTNSSSISSSNSTAGYSVGGPMPPFTIRLAGGGSTTGTARSGWLQVSADGGRTWGSACVKRFGAMEANVACRQLGLGQLGMPRTALSSGFMSSVPQPSLSEMPTLLNVQHCGGSETSLSDCVRLPWGHQDCISPYGMAGVVCMQATGGNSSNSNTTSNTTNSATPTVRLVGGSSPASGRVEVSLGDGTWGSVCGAASTGLWSSLLNAFAGQLLNGTGSLLSQLLLSATSSNLTTQLTSTTNTSVLVSRLFNGTLNSNISLQAESEGQGAWGALAATVVCRQLGYATGVPTVGGNASVGAPAVVLSGLMCAGNESSLLECGNGGWGDAGACVTAAGQVAGVTCSGVASPSPLPPASQAPPPSPVPPAPAQVPSPSPSSTPRPSPPLPPTVTGVVYEPQPPSSTPSSSSSPAPPSVLPPSSPQPSTSPPASPFVGHPLPEPSLPPPAPPAPSQSPDLLPTRALMGSLAVGDLPPLPSPTQVPPSDSPPDPSLWSSSPAPPSYPYSTANSYPPPLVPTRPPSGGPPPSALPPSYPGPVLPSPVPPSPVPPSPSVAQLPPTDAQLTVMSPDSAAADVTTVFGVGFVRIRTSGASGAQWNYLCGDPWAGWDSAAANAACRQAGYPAGGEALRVWRSGDLPLMLLGKLNCQGSETSLSGCAMTGNVSGRVELWHMDAPAWETAGVCNMLAAVRCRAYSTQTVGLRAASSPAPSGTATTSAAATVVNDTAVASTGVSVGINGSTTTTTIFTARLEALAGNGYTYGAVCRDSGFDDRAAAVACRSMGFAAGGSVYDNGTAALSPDVYAVQGDRKVDAHGSFVGTAAAVRCRGTESRLEQCALWRAETSVDATPCRAAAWVACVVAATSA